MHDKAATTLDSLGYEQQLKRAMSLTDVVVHGMIYMVPMAPIAIFGFIYNVSSGMVALAYLVAAVAMTFSALSYKEMAKRYPVAGSVYSYVRFGLGNYAGFLAGWAILLDYLLLPALLSVFAAVAMTNIWPQTPTWIWIVLFVFAAALINLAGIELTATVNKLFLGVQLTVIALFVTAAVSGIIDGHASFSWRPFFNSAHFSWPVIFGALPIAALSFLGLDAVSTLNEEARGGGAAVSRATMILLLVMTLLFITQVYLAALYVPAHTHFAPGSESNDAFYNIAGQVGGTLLRVVVTTTSALIAIFANTIASQATSSRLVFSMARDRRLPRALATVDKRQIPRNAVVLIAGTSLIIGLLGSQNPEILTSLVTFGALTAYILLHVAVVVRFALIEQSRRYGLHWLSPLLGAAMLCYALWHTSTQAKIVGITWMGVGVIIALALRRFGQTRLLDPVAK